MKKIFISYNHSDRNLATKLAINLSQDPDIDVFIDYWEISIGDSLLDKIESAIDSSSFLVVILSKNSVESKWVQDELKYAYYKEPEIGRNFILPVLIDQCKIPMYLIDKLRINLRDDFEYDRGLQLLLNKIRGGRLFSIKVRDFLNNSDFNSPYNNKAQKEGRKILSELAQYQELDVEEHQFWFLWELYKLLLKKYTCTIKIGKNVYSNQPSNSYIFMIVDRWSETSHEIILSEEEYLQGLWEGEVNLFEGKRLTSNALKLVSSRLSFNKNFNPHTEQNPFLNSAKPRLDPIIQNIKEKLNLFDIGSQQSFLYDLQYLIFDKKPRSIKVLVGSGSDDMCYVADSWTTTKHSLSGNNWEIFEIYDPFFQSLKSTSVCSNHLNNNNLYEGDVNLMSNKTEVVLGLA